MRGERGLEGGGTRDDGMGGDARGARDDERSDAEAMVGKGAKGWVEGIG